MDGVSKRRANDRNDRRRGVCRNRGINGGSYDHVGPETNDLFRQCWQSVPKAFGEARRHIEVLAIDVTKAPHAIHKIVDINSGYLGY
jgi:hypothetical protein